ncbi:unnamed protein product, partial [Mesorhabditis belari]|uniref:Histone-lysine N-methyltransferase SETMAR n=1 Tax=Mesorhabditis belari TaxID=2138241 RepID=A0AAF3FJJ1_9BILA
MMVVYDPACRISSKKALHHAYFNGIEEKLEELGWETLPHPPYSPDISLSDYHLFCSMRNHLAGNRFKDVQEVEKWLTDFFAFKQANFYAEGIHSLHGRWKQILLTYGEYIVD